jgi:DNA-binding transcriptional regulator YiaG
MAIPRLCSIPDCGKPMLARGWCSAHWERWRAHGDPLGSAKPRPPRKFFEDVVMRYDGEECLFWPFTRNNMGYGELRHRNKRGLVHRHICEEIHGPPPTPKHEAAHSCGNGHLGCVSGKHLSWKTRTENQADRKKHGTGTAGERHGAAKLTNEAVAQIRSLRGSVTQREIARRFGITQSTVSQIQRGLRWPPQ